MAPNTGDFTRKRPLKTLAIGTAAAIAVALVPVQVASASAAPAPTSVTARAADATSGEDLLRAVVFGDLSATPELVGVVPATSQTTEAETVIDGLIASVDTRNPEFFDEFAADIRSGDVHRVESALSSAQDALATATVDEGYATEGDLISPQWAAIAAVVFAAAAVVVGGVAVLLVNTVAVNNVYAQATVTKGASANSGAASLSEEKLIAGLTAQLAK